MRYTVTVWHGEWRSTFSVVDTGAPEAEQPAILSTHATRAEADDSAARRNGGHLDAQAALWERVEFARKVARAWGEAS